MRDPNRIDRILEQVRQFWIKNPDWRLGQIVVNAAREDTPDLTPSLICPRCNHPVPLPFGTLGVNVFSTEDNRLESGLTILEERYSKK